MISQLRELNVPPDFRGLISVAIIARSSSSGPEPEARN